jgi:hypothetical protein
VRIFTQAIAGTASLVLASSIAAAAGQVDPEKLPEVKCSSLTFKQEFLKKYPKAPAACIEARVLDGKTYMKVKGKLFVKDQGSLTITFQNVAGDDLTTITFKNPKGIKVIYDEQVQQIEGLKTGEVLTFWIPESRFSAKATAAE